MNNDIISRKWLLDEYDRIYKGPPGRARKLIEDAPPIEQKSYKTKLTNIVFEDGTLSKFLYFCCCNCGVPVTENDSYCRKCGVPLEWEDKGEDTNE